MERIAMNERYTGVAIALHWIIALLVINNIFLAIASEDWSKAERMAAMGWHKSLGILILLLTVLRILWRMGHRPPPLPAHMAGWQVAASKATHFLFYLLLIGLPLGGWFFAVSAERPVDMFGLFQLPVLPGSEDLKEIAHEGHEAGGIAMLFLIVLHLAAVLKHHLIDKTPLLRRMLPGND